MNLIGLDIGTTGCKATLFDESGILLGSASREYAVRFPHPGWAEQDAEQVWALAVESLQELVATTGAQQVAAIGLSVQGEAVAPIDMQGRALRPMILGMDTRTSAQNQELAGYFGARYLFDRTGMPLHTINTLPKLLWLKQNKPDLWRSAERFLLYEDFFLMRMTGRALISRCLASRTQLYDLGGGGWLTEVLDYLELGAERLADPVNSGTPGGEMRPGVARQIGFANLPLVVTGGHDQACGALGVGLVQPGLAMVSTGTAEVVEVALASPGLNAVLYEGNISIYEHVIPGLYLAMTLNHSGGLLLRWFRDTFCLEELRLAASTDRDAYDLILQDAPAEPTRLLVLPHFAGSGTPMFDTRSKGAILGLTFEVGKPELAKAILEGLTYELRLNLDLLQQSGIRIDELRAIGGGAKSSLWLRLKADIAGIPIAVPQVTEAAGWGAALLAGVGAGLFGSAAEAAAQTLQIKERLAPDNAVTQQYTQKFELYRQVYPAVRAIQVAL